MTIWTPTLRTDRPAYLALADAIERDRADGVLAVGEKLPPHRNLAFALGLTVGTVTRGYAEATRRGLVRGEVGRGTFVEADGAQELRDAMFVRRAAVSDGLLNLTITRPALDVLLDDLSASLARLGHSDLATLADYGGAEGQPRHREAIAGWLGSRGAPVDADRIIISSGAQNALALAAAGLFRPGDVVAVDPLTYPGFKTAAGLFGLNLTAVECDADGMTPDGLAAAARMGARAVYLMPNVHNPTTVTMPLARREALAAAARADDLLILEDDVYGFLVPEPLPAFAALAPERTALIGSVSKFMAPALRIGWIAPPADRAAEVASALRALAWMASPLLAEIVAAPGELLGRARERDGARPLVLGDLADDLADRQRDAARRRMAVVRRTLGRWLHEAPEIAMHAWLPLPEPWRADAFVAEAEARRIAVTGAGAFAVGRGRAPHAIRFGLGAAPLDRLEEGLATLAGLLAAPPRAGAAVV